MLSLKKKKIFFALLGVKAGENFGVFWSIRERDESGSQALGDVGWNTARWPWQGT